jgi:hypothetical protein
MSRTAALIAQPAETEPSNLRAELNNYRSSDVVGCGRHLVRFTIPFGRSTTRKQGEHRQDGEVAL